MIELFRNVIGIFKAYNGTSWHMALFALSLVYLFAVEHNKAKRTLLVYASVCLAALFFFPLFAAVVIRIMDEETYYRVIWLLPVNVVTAYAAVKLMMSRKESWLKAGIAALAALLIIKGGSYTYAHPTFAKAENWYNLPQMVVKIGEVIEPEEGWVMAAVEPELLPYMRQYSSNIHMPYGREMLVDRWGLYHSLYNEMTAEIIRPGDLYEQAEQNFCDYIVLRQNHLIDGTLEEYGAEKVASVYGYDIYQTNYNFYWWKEYEEKIEN